MAEILRGKECHNCQNGQLTIAATGQVLVVRCLKCKHHSYYCPTGKCNGRMGDDLRNDPVEQKCGRCAYRTSYVEDPKPIQVHKLFV